ncbi:MAG: type II secretion system F family protein [Nitrospirae bacterium]|nr:type II secretion system F family protein [Nitrospirota bacterium]
MPFFAYKAVDRHGEVLTGFIEGNDIDTAYTNISSSGLYILSIKKLDALTKFYLDKIKYRGITNKDIIEFANGLAVMVRAGIPLLTAVHDISGAVENKNFKRVIEDVSRMVELGASFSTALSLHKDVFSEIFIHLVKVGEETGQLDKSLTDAAMHLQRMEDLKGAIKRALMYPVFAIITTTGALLFWLVYVLPKITVLFKDMSVELPPLTKAIIASSDFTRESWYILLLIPVTIYIILKLLSRKESTKYYLDLARLKLPIVKSIVFNKLHALFAEQLRIMLASGLTIDRSFDIIINVIDNAVFRRALITVKEDILLGSRINEALKKHEMIFPNIVVRLITIGEETGGLTEQLNYLSEEFIKKLNEISAKMEKLIEPIVIVVIGAIFLVIIAGLLLPIYNLVATVGK